MDISSDMSFIWGECLQTPDNKNWVKSYTCKTKETNIVEFHLHVFVIVVWGGV